MNIIKRNGSEVKFDSQKIDVAITKANNSVSDENKITVSDIESIVERITNDIESSSYTHSVEDIQDMVEKELTNLNKYQLAKNYIIYRYQHQINRESDEFDARITSIINDSNEEVKTENANKNPTILSTQRDYIAGEVSKNYSKKYIFSKEIIDAHEAGMIHVHDMDYTMMKSYNCSLINVDDMLQNGTIISGTKIDKPKSFTTACNVMTQIMAQVASSQYGGNAINVYHVSKFVDVSRQKFIKKEKERIEKYGLTLSEEQFNSIIEDEVKEEIKKGVQMIQYQINTLMTTNG